MKKLTKKWLIFISSVFIIASLIFPFYLADKNDSLLTILSASFTAIGTIIALIALYIAIVLYEKFGLESKFIEKKADKVLELVDLLKGNIYTVKTKEFSYFMRFGIEDFKKLNKEPFYIYMKDKVMLIDYEDYELGTNKIINISKSYWLPKEIKEKLEFFTIYATIKQKKSEIKNEKYAKLIFEFGKKGKMEWSATFPEITVKDFLVKKTELSLEIEKWLSKHCEIKLELNLDKSNEVKKN